MFSRRSWRLSRASLAAVTAVVAQTRGGRRGARVYPDASSRLSRRSSPRSCLTSPRSLRISRILRLELALDARHFALSPRRLASWYCRFELVAFMDILGTISRWSYRADFPYGLLTNLATVITDFLGIATDLLAVLANLGIFGRCTGSAACANSGATSPAAATKITTLDRYMALSFLFRLLGGRAGQLAPIPTLQRSITPGPGIG